MKKCLLILVAACVASSAQASDNRCHVATNWQGTPGSPLVTRPVPQEVFAAMEAKGYILDQQDNSDSPAVTYVFTLGISAGTDSNCSDGLICRATAGAGIGLNRYTYKRDADKRVTDLKTYHVYSDSAFKSYFTNPANPSHEKHVDKLISKLAEKFMKNIPDCNPEQ